MGLMGINESPVPGDGKEHHRPLANGVSPRSVSPGWGTSVPGRAENQLASTLPQPGSKSGGAPGFTPY